jgi:hypothetical protein
MVHNEARMASGRYLRRRGHTWFFRFRWPAALAACHVSGELIVSLKTRDYRCALHRARVLRLGLESLMTRFTPSKTKREAEGLVRQWIAANEASCSAVAWVDCNAAIRSSLPLTSLTTGLAPGSNASFAAGYRSIRSSRVSQPQIWILILRPLSACCLVSSVANWSSLVSSPAVVTIIYSDRRGLYFKALRISLRASVVVSFAFGCFFLHCIPTSFFRFPLR